LVKYLKSSQFYQFSLVEWATRFLVTHHFEQFKWWANQHLSSLHLLPLTMYQGHFIAPGYLKVYFGYRLSDGTVVVNAQPLEMTIN